MISVFRVMIQRIILIIRSCVHMIMKMTNEVKAGKGLSGLDSLFVHVRLLHFAPRKGCGGLWRPYINKKAHFSL